MRLEFQIVLVKMDIMMIINRIIAQCVEISASSVILVLIIVYNAKEIEG